MKKNIILKALGVLSFIIGVLDISRISNLPFIFRRIHNNFSQVIPQDYNQFSIQNQAEIFHLYLSLSLLVVGILLIVFPKYFSRFLLHIKQLFTSFISFILGLKLQCKIIISLLILINISIKFYLVKNMPVFVDEAWTYIVFAQKDILTAMSNYTAPNNHILHSLLVNLSLKLPVDTLTALRFPNFFANILMVISVFVVYSKLLNKRISILLTIIFSSTFPMMYYGYIARGYMIYIWAFLMLYFTGIRILQSEKINSKYLTLWILSGIIGFWTVPAFLYPLFSIFIFITYYLIRLKRWYDIKVFFITNFITGVIVLYLYLPVFIISGYKSVTANRYVSAWSRISVIKTFNELFDKTSWFLFNLPLVLTFAVFLGFIYYFYKHKWTKEIQLSMFLIAVVPILMLIHAVVPRERIWTYWLIPVFYVIGVFYQEVIAPKLSFNKSLGLSITVALMYLFIFSVRITSYESDSIYMKKMVKYLRNHKARSIYFGKDTYLGYNIIYYYQVHKDSIQYKESFTDFNKKEIPNYEYFLLYELDSIFCRKNGLQKVNYADVMPPSQILYKRVR